MNDYSGKGHSYYYISHYSHANLFYYHDIYIILVDDNTNNNNFPYLSYHKQFGGFMITNNNTYILNIDDDAYDNGYNFDIITTKNSGGFTCEIFAETSTNGIINIVHVLTNQCRS